MNGEFPYSKFYDLDPLERALYEKLMICAGPDGKECTETVVELSRQFKRSTGTTRKYLKNLEVEGFIAIEKGGGPRGTNKYNLLFDEDIGL